MRRAPVLPLKRISRIKETKMLWVGDAQDNLATILGECLRYKCLEHV